MKQIRFLVYIVITIVAVATLYNLQFKNKSTGDSVSGTAESDVRYDFNDLPVKGMVTMIDLGATECVPCKMMAPILKKLEAAYRDRAVIAFIDVWKHRDQAPRFGVRAIPTQVFFDPDGKEVYRHQGFMSENAIVEQLTRMGVEKPAL
ncbi:thioredoxin family protein [Desulfotignum balticum]|uniref:thioredoxin family protein n=1 Tax=Desulfotignum balticum TaxID=115781 RepID=UPI0003FEE43F|nr:thioredoxin family protein [Desulfotignum balticum]